MAGENEAELKLLLDIRDAVQKLADFDNKWSGSARKTAAESEVASKGVRGLGDSFDALRGTLVAVAGSLVAVKLAQFAKESLAAAAESEDAQARLQASIEATGGAAGRTTEQLVNVAAQIQDTTTVSDEAVEGLQNVLLGFTHIIGDTFDRATVDIVDLSAKTRHGVEETALAVGKALDSIGQGSAKLEGLARIGVRFSTDQLTVIQRLIDTGDAAGAQAVVLEELERRAKGAAEALNKTLGGALANVKDEYGEVKEAFGKGLGKELVGDARDVAESLRSIRPFAEDSGRAIGVLLGFLARLLSFWPALAGAVAIGERAVVGSVEVMAVAVANLLEGFGGLSGVIGFKSLSDGAKEAAASLRSGPIEALDALQEGLRVVAEERAAQVLKALEGFSQSGAKESLQETGRVAAEALDPIPEKAQAAGNAIAEHIPAGAKKAEQSLVDLAKAARDAVEAQGAGPSGSRPSDVDALARQKAGLEDTVAALKSQQEQGSLSAEELARLAQTEDDLREVNQRLHNATLDVNRALEAQQAAVQAVVTPMEAGADAARRYADAGLAIPGAIDPAAQSLGKLAEETKKAREEIGPATDTMGHAGDTAAILAKQWTEAGQGVSKLGEQSDQTKAAIAGLAERQQDGIDASLGLADAVGKTTAELAALKESNPAGYAEEWAKSLTKVRDLQAEINGDGPAGLQTTSKLLTEIIAKLATAEAA